jgi:hypothetical protein
MWRGADRGLAAIPAYLDEVVGPDKAMIAARGEMRRFVQLLYYRWRTGFGDMSVIRKSVPRE